LKNIRYLFLLAIISSLSFYSCEEQISDLGQNFINPDDTLGTLLLDSKTDSITISVNNYKHYINTFNSGFMMVGNYQSWEARSLLRFTNISADYDSATVVSARIIMKYGDYFFRDSLGSVAFDVLKMNNLKNYSTITADSIGAGDIDNVVQGSYSGNPVDSAQISIDINTQLAKDWLEYTADTSYSVKNNGVIMIPTGGSTIKGFFASGTGEGLRPALEMIVTKNSQTDTLVFDQSESVFISDAPSSVIIPDRIYLQSGIAFRSILNFGLSKLPSNVIINDALLTLTLDTANSYLSSVSDQRLVAAMITDSVSKTDSLGFITLNRVGNEYSVRFILIMQNWNSGFASNLGLALRNVSENSTMDVFTFFGPTYSDTSVVPRLRIRYTLRDSQKISREEKR
jgi:hypothetical protein